MNFSYTPRGTCSRLITFDINEGIVTNVKFTGGCNGNLKGIAGLTEGMAAEDIIEKIKGIKCGLKGTSCPDQLALALEAAIQKEQDGE